MKLEKENEMFDTWLYASDWRYSAAIVGLNKYLEFYKHEIEYELTDDYLKFHRADITEERYLKFAESYYEDQFLHRELERYMALEQWTEDQTKRINELLKGIERQMPALYESLKEFGGRGIRGAVAYKLKNQFKFNSNIICNIGADIDNAEVFRSFAETERYFTLASLINLKEQIGIGNIYFDNVNEVASRINVKDYVPNNALVFNVDEIDALLERIIIGNMASIKEASNFAIYPSTCYPWTEYLLENYVAKYSQKFSLLHICYAESKCAGAIVKRSSQIDSMDAVVVEYLVVHPEIQSGNEALNGLVEDGYIARKRYKNIEDLLMIAKAKRRV